MANQHHDSYVAGDEPHDGEWQALARFLAGESSPAEAAAVEERLSRSSEEAALVAALERVGARLAVEPLTGIDVEQALARVRNRLESGEVHSLEVERTRRLSPMRSRNWWIALAAGVVFVVGTTLLLQNRHGTGVGGVIPGIAKTYASPVGARDSVTLVDGTRVLLGPGSELTLSPSYGRTDRDVTLRGEAFIEVAHKGETSPPFTVHAGAAAIRDVGTAFAVHSDSGTGVRVVVTSGAVLLKRAVSRDSGTLLRAGDVGLIQRGDTVVTRRGAATADDLAWTRGELAFHDASMDDVRADLRRWYGIELVVADSSLARQHFNNTFRNDSLDQVLRVIASTLGARVERHGDTAIVREAREGGTR